MLNQTTGNDGWMRGRLAESEGGRTLLPLTKRGSQGPDDAAARLLALDMRCCHARSLGRLRALPRNRVLPQRTVEAEHPHAVPQQKANKISKLNVVPLPWR